MSKKIINLSDLNVRVAQRGRKSTVTPEDIADAQALEVQMGWEVEEASENGADFSAYFADAVAKDATKDEASVRNAWQSRFRQRCAALAKQSGVDMGAVFADDGTCYFIRKS